MERRYSHEADRRDKSLNRLFLLGLIPFAFLMLDAIDRVSEQIFNHDLLSADLNRVLSVGGLLGVMILGVGYYRSRRLRSQIVFDTDELSSRRSDDLVQEDITREKRHRIRAVLHAAESFRIVFQPIIELSSGRVAGHEALARFAGDASPDELFALAREVGLGVELEMLAITTALASKPAQGYLSINVGPETLLSKEFLNVLLDDPEPERIVVELTEHEEFKNYPIILVVLKKIRRLGIRIAIDDAGSGVSSLQHIVKLSPDLIKLDRSLISFIDTDPVRRTLGVTLALFAGEIGARLIAEGIERQGERDACSEIGIAFGQGYLLGRPAEQPVVDLVGSLSIGALIA
jgi:EAL domain-containing protein (putative c-di-GMP-specific phosphodiesterase class I)